jgi:integrase
MARAKGSSQGSIFGKPGNYGIRWPEDGRRPQKPGFRTKGEAQRWFDDNVAPRLRRGGPSAEIGFDDFCELFLERHTGAPRTVATLRERLMPARKTFGAWTLRELEGAADDVARWREALPSDSARFRHTSALRQCLARAIAWRYMTINPAVEAGPNPKPRAEELQPFTPAEVEAIAAALGPVSGPLVIFAAETGLRTHEWAALERRDVDRSGPAVRVERRFASGRLTPYPKTRKARRRVPLTARALAAIDSLPPRIDTPLLFPALRGGYIDIDNWRLREWYPALDAAGLRRRGPYHLRHTFATEALAAGVTLFDLARLMGTSSAMIDETYGHLAQDSEQRLRELLARRSGVYLASEEE